MPSGAEPIQVTVIVGGETYPLTTHRGEYRSLMALIYDRIYIDGFGECRGMGRCGTCRVTVDGDQAALTGMDRNEAATLGKMGGDGDGYRLACQIMVDERLQGRTISVQLEN